MNAIKKSGVPVKDHRAVFLGAGSAGVGVARQIVEYFIKEGLSEKEAREKFWFVDSQVRFSFSLELLNSFRVINHFLKKIFIHMLILSSHLTSTTPRTC